MNGRDKLHTFNGMLYTYPPRDPSLQNLYSYQGMCSRRPPERFESGSQAVLGDLGETLLWFWFFVDRKLHSNEYEKDRGVDKTTDIPSRCRNWGDGHGSSHDTGGQHSTSAVHLDDLSVFHGLPRRSTYQATSKHFQ